MLHDLAPTSRPDCIVQMPARFAEPMTSAARIALRWNEIGRARLPMVGVLVSQDEPLFGGLDAGAAAIANAAPMASFLASARLDAQKAAAAEFRRVFSGPMRSAMASLTHAFGGARLYLAFYDEGFCAIVPARTGHGRWRLAALRFTDASTMEEERACVAANRISAATFSIMWETLIERAKREIEDDPGLRSDLIDDPVARTIRPWKVEGHVPAPPEPPGFEDDWRPDDHDQDHSDRYDDVPPHDEAPPGDHAEGGRDDWGDAFDGPRTFDELEDAIDDQAVDVEDPSRGSGSPEEPDDDEGEIAF